MEKIVELATEITTKDIIRWMILYVNTDNCEIEDTQKIYNEYLKYKKYGVLI